MHFLVEDLGFCLRGLWDESLVQKLQDGVANLLQLILHLDTVVLCIASLCLIALGFLLPWLRPFLSIWVSQVLKLFNTPLYHYITYRYIVWQRLGPPRLLACLAGLQKVRTPKFQVPRMPQPLPGPSFCSTLEMMRHAARRDPTVFL